MTRLLLDCVACIHCKRQYSMDKVVELLLRHGGGQHTRNKDGETRFRTEFTRGHAMANRLLD
jgi:hypothetical protein